MSQRCSSVLEAVRQTILSSVARLANGQPSGARRLLDVGCWDGSATREYAAAFGARALGVEVFDAPASEARRRDVEVSQIDLEVGRFPWPDESIDLVIANQVLEHLKNVWHPMSEMSRVLRPGGWLIVSVPNLASLHNRILLMLGLQPSSIRTQGPHVRGFTTGEIVRLVRLGSVFAIEQVRGVGFYPLGVSWAAGPARLWPAASHTTVVLARKRPGGALNPWSEYLKGLETSEPQTFLRG